MRAGSCSPSRSCPGGPECAVGVCCSRCSAVLLKLLCSKLVVKEKKKFIILQTAAASFYRGRSPRRSGWQSRGTKPRSWWALGSWHPLLWLLPVPIHPPAPGWAMRDGALAGACPGEVHLLLYDFYHSPIVGALSRSPWGGGAGTLLSGAASCGTRRASGEARQCVRRAGQGSGDRGAGHVPIAFPGRGS